MWLDHIVATPLQNMLKNYSRKARKPSSAPKATTEVAFIDGIVEEVQLNSYRSTVPQTDIWNDKIIASELSLADQLALTDSNSTVIEESSNDVVNEQIDTQVSNDRCFNICS